MRLFLFAALAALALASPVAAQSGGPVTPRAGDVSIVTTGGTPVNAITGPSNGCYIANPLTATDEGIGLAENIYIDPTAASATTTGNGTTVTIEPGRAWFCPAFSAQPVSVNAATSGHKFSVVRW